MVRLFKQFSSSEKGQALAIVLCLLAIGGLTIGVSLNYATTSLKGGQIIREDVKGIYAAGAGVEYVLWSLSENGTAPTQLSENVNRMAVNMTTVNQGTYTLYLGELVSDIGVHVDYLDVNGEMSSTNVSGRYEYTITIIWQAPQGEKPIKLTRVGARIPPDYSYLSGSAASFAENLATDDDDLTQTLDGQGAWLLNWEIPTPHPEVSENVTERTQSFYITGTGSQEGHYAWVIAQSQDVGTVGEITGTKYKITARATRPEDGRTTATIVADVMIRDDGAIFIVSWQISS